MLDRLMWDILRLLWTNTDRTKPTYYTAANLGTVQREVLEALASGQYCTIIDGTLQAAATWYVRDDGRIIITNAACNPGYMYQLVKLIRKSVQCSGAIWHRTKYDDWRDFPKQRGLLCGN